MKRVKGCVKEWEKGRWVRMEEGKWCSGVEGQGRVVEVS